jgi:hypothetical protein
MKFLPNLCTWALPSILLLSRRLLLPRFAIVYQNTCSTIEMIPTCDARGRD